MFKVGCFKFLILVFLLLGGYLFFLNIGNWLNISEAPFETDVILCLSGNGDRIIKSAFLLDNGYAGKIMITTAASMSLAQKEQVAFENIIVPESFATSTFEEALNAKKLLQTGRFKSVMIISDPYHMYRVKWTFDHVYKNVPIKLSYVATDPTWAQGFWWDKKRSRFFVCSELPKILYYWLGHGLFGIEKDPEWARKMEILLNQFLNKIL